MSLNSGKGKMSNTDLLQIFIVGAAATLLIVVAISVATNFVKGKLEKTMQPLEAEARVATKKFERPVFIPIAEFESYKTETEEQFKDLNERHDALVNLYTKDSETFRQIHIDQNVEINSLKEQLAILQNRPAATLPPSPIQFSPLKFEPLRVNLVHYQKTVKPKAKKAVRKQ